MGKETLSEKVESLEKQGESFQNAFRKSAEERSNLISIVSTLRSDVAELKQENKRLKQQLDSLNASRQVDLGVERF